MRSLLQGIPGYPVVKTTPFRCRRHGFEPWSGNLAPSYCVALPKKKEKKKKDTAIL